MREENTWPEGIIDRSEMYRALTPMLEIDPGSTAIITVDCHRGHLDPAIATMPVPAEVATSVVSAVARVVRGARSAQIPVIHVILQNRLLPSGTPGSMSNPFWRALEETKQSLTPVLRSTARDHNLAGSPQTQLIPEIGPEPGDIVIDTKRRLSIFRETDLDLLLRDLRVDTVVLCGINTNTCVLCAAFEAFNRDLRVVVISDAVASMYGDDLHFFGLQNVARCLGWVVTCDEFAALLGPGGTASGPAVPQRAAAHGRRG